MNGLHSARLSTSSISNTVGGNVSGDLDLYLDCSSVTGDKALYFYFINQAFGGDSFDSLRVLLSTNGGTSFSQIGVFDSAENWKLGTVQLSSNSAQTVVRLSGYVTPQLDFSDIGVDSLYIAMPCSGVPGAGTISPVTANCAGGSYTLMPVGTTMAGGLSYTWEQSVNSGATWTAIPGARS